MLRSAVPADTPALVSLATSTGVFQPGEAEVLLGNVLRDLFGGRLAQGHFAHVSVDYVTSSPSGWVYFSQNATTNLAWDLWWIGVAPEHQGKGIGGKLLRYVESHIQKSGGSIITIETSSLPAFYQTRCFYTKHGYAESGQVLNFYGDGDNKIIYTKSFVATSTI